MRVEARTWWVLTQVRGLPHCRCAGLEMVELGLDGNRLVDTKPRSIFASTSTHKSPKVSLHTVPAKCLDSIYKPLKSLGRFWTKKSKQIGIFVRNFNDLANIRV
jgi:hypothetical protein